MGQFEVTQAHWQRVMGMTLREQRARDPDQPRPVGDGTTRDHVGESPDYPIYFTSHADAEDFCRKLTEVEARQADSSRIRNTSFRPRLSGSLPVGPGRRRPPRLAIS